ncbi:hypothetical protein QI155_03230 [Thermodesulfovibrio sp. 1176]|nr:hypothetical protein [Thermodesulfovibrio sp. 1176]
MTEKRSTCGYYSGAIENIVTTVNTIAESAISDPNVSSLDIDCVLYNAQLQRSFSLSTKIQRN